MRVFLVFLTVFLTGCDFNQRKEPPTSLSSSNSGSSTPKKSEVNQKTDYDQSFNKNCSSQYLDVVKAKAIKNLRLAQENIPGFQWFKNKSKTPRCEAITWITNRGNSCAFKCTFTNMEAEDFEIILYREEFHFERQGKSPDFVVHSLKHINTL